MNSLNKKTIGAIDIGSNAIRLLISHVYGYGTNIQINKAALVRLPIRLGEDVFLKDEISNKKKKKLIKGIVSFKLQMEIYGVEKYGVVATSAMRNAVNGSEVCQEILDKTGINIQIISGKEESEIILLTDLKNVINNRKDYIYIDVGGGSTELTVFSKGKAIISRSFRIGTVRMLNNTIFKSEWEEMKKWVKELRKEVVNPIFIGFGGNIIKIFKISGKPIGTSLSYNFLKEQYILYKSMNLKDKILKLKLNPDRADVIEYATKIYMLNMKWIGAKEMIVPKIGVTDGLTKFIYSKNGSSMNLRLHKL